MRLVENVRFALGRLRRRPMRSFLLLQGTIWGVAVALFPAAVLLGTRQAVLERASEVGGDRVTIAADPTTVHPRALAAADVTALRDAFATAGIPLVASAGIATTRPATPGPGVPDAFILGPADAPTARGLDLVEGRLADPAAAAPETVVEGILAREIAERRGGSALGADVSLPSGGGSARVVGVLRERPALARRTNDMGFDTEHPVFRGLTGKLLTQLGVPFGDDAWKRSDRCAYLARAPAEVEWILLRVRPTDTRAAAKTASRALEVNGASVVVFYAPVLSLVVGHDLDRFRTVSLALFLSCLVMGGVVMANVGLLTALRRTGEVAIHRVEGATQRDVAIQWLAEGAVLSIVGAVIGGILACGLAELRIRLEAVSGMGWAFPWGHAAVAGLLSVTVGLLALAVPAARAARRSPAEALVDE